MCVCVCMRVCMCMCLYKYYVFVCVYIYIYTLEHRLLVLFLCMFYNIFSRFVHCDVFKQFQAPSRQLRSHKYKLFIPFCKYNERKICLVE